MVKFWSISKNTFVQTIRQPIYGVLILVTFAVLVLDVPLSGWTVSSDYQASDQKMLETLGLSTLLVSGLFIAAFSASSVLAREIEDRTALTVIAKPVSRATFVLGKFAGVTAAVGVAFYLCAIVFLMTVRHRVMSASSDPYDMPVIVLGLLAIGIALIVALLGNYLFGWHFSSASVWLVTALMTLAMGVILFVGKNWQIVPIGWDWHPGSEGHFDATQAITPQLVISILMMLMAVIVFCAVAITSSTRLGQVVTLLICLGVMMLGSMHPMLRRLAEDTPALYALTFLAPNLTYFYGLDAITMGKTIPIHVVGGFALYCVLYVAAVLSLGVALFQGRQLEGQATSSTMPGIVGLLAWAGRAAALVMAIWGVVVLSMLAKPQADLAYLVISGAALLACAGVTWTIWGYFSRGVKSAYYVLAGLAVLGLVWSGLIYLLPQIRDRVFYQDDTQSMAIAAVSAVVLLILVLPKTRRHFKSVPRSSATG